jgi:hypothetical protein
LEEEMQRGNHKAHSWGEDSKMTNLLVGIHWWEATYKTRAILFAFATIKQI